MHNLSEKRNYWPCRLTTLRRIVICFFISFSSYAATSAGDFQSAPAVNPIFELRNEELRASLHSNGEISTSGVVRVSFKPGVAESTYRIVVDVPGDLGSRSDELLVSFRIRLDGWDSYRYVGYGWRYPDREFSYLANPHPDQGGWFTDHIDPDGYEKHVAKYKPKPNSPGDFEIYIKGVAGSHGAIVEIDNFMLLESAPPELMVSGQAFDLGKECFSDDCLTLPRARQALAEKPELKEQLKLYIKGLFDIDVNKNGSDLYLETGQVLLRGVPVIPGDWRRKTPPVNEYTTTHRYLWHALWMPRAHLARYAETGDRKYLDAAIELIDGWVYENIDNQSDDLKYAWYDHGVAERTLTLTLAYVELVEAGGDEEVLRRLANMIYRHQELLASDWFYSRNQPFRWHNHALFQDMALMISAELVTFKRSEVWSRRAQYRSVLQFEELVSDEGVSVENSMGYHVAEAKLCSQTTDWFRLIATDYSLAQAEKLGRVCSAMSLFSEAMTWPDGRQPAFGDSTPQLNSGLARAGISGDVLSQYVNFYPQSGYFVARGMNGAWQLTFIAPSNSLTHKHQDNLNIILWAYGVAWIVDPGYYTYQMEDPITKYARGPDAHNALHYGSVVQSIEPGSSELFLQQDGSNFIASGRTTAFSEAVGSRRIEGDLNRNRLDVVDELVAVNDCCGSRDFMLQFGDGVKATLNGDRVYLSYPGIGAGLQLESMLFGEYCKVIDSEVSNRMDGPGWLYPAFGEAVRADALLCTGLPERFEWSIEMLRI